MRPPERSRIRYPGATPRDPLSRTILTDAAARRLRPPMSGRREVWDAALPGFGIRITANGARSWICMTRLHGKPIRLTWKWPATSLAEARQAARDAITEAARGEDPRRPKNGPEAPPDAFQLVADIFLEQHSRRKKRTWAEDARMLDVYILPQWRDRPLGTITRADVHDLVERIATKHGPVQANRVLSLVKKLFSWSLDTGRLDVHPVARFTPPAVEVARDRILSDSELAALWPAWTALGYPFGTAFQLVALTAARRGEVERMAWTELELDTAALWQIPSERIKSKVPHVIPLSPPAVALLAAVPRHPGGPFVLSTSCGRRPLGGWSKAVARASELSGVTEWSTHDLRRTVRTGLSKLGVAPDVAELVLGHRLSGVRAVYDRYTYLPERRDALERWAAHVVGIYPT
jgi:integrase